MRFGRIAWGMAAATSIAGSDSGVAQPATAVVRGELGARVDSFLTRAAYHGFSGAIVVAHRGEVVLSKGYGLADRDRQIPITSTTPFFVGSLAKQFTAAAILRLTADGKLALDDSLGRFFRDAPAETHAITIRQLLSHTAGLPYLPTSGLFGRATRDSVMREMLAEPVSFRPGTRWEYSTPGYILLAGVIERASGTTYEQYLRSLFARAGLNETGFVGERARWSAFPVRSYSDGSAETSLADIPALPRFVGAGSIITTAADLHRWYAALLRGDVLPRSARDTLFAPAFTPRLRVRQALGWNLIELPTGTLRQAAGDIGGFNAELRHYVDEDLVVAFASNVRVRGRGYREIMLNYVARTWRGEDVPLPPAVTPLTATDLESFPGTYVLANGGHIDFWRSGDTLFVGAADAAGVAALAGHDSLAAARASELDARAERFLAAVEAQDGAESFMHASIPADARRSFLDRLYATFGDSIARRVSVVGTAVESPTDSRSYLRVQRGDASEVMSLVWSGGMLVGLQPGGRAAYTLRLRGEGPGELASFDLFTGRLLRIARVDDRELALMANGVTRRAVR
ncbi:MAG TPA: serine hydrolase domain-containing protein [Gemmatimonadaceae bacterium]|nr:serine hydrolase domain-containing protein [Gemmatimonadaceae bacterium]